MKRILLPALLAVAIPAAYAHPPVRFGALGPAGPDTVDNDGDTFIDFPADPGCIDANDMNEVNVVAPPFAVAPATCVQARASSDVVFCQDFDGATVGDWTVANLERDFPGAIMIKGPTGSVTPGVGRTSIVSGAADVVSGNSLRVLFPANEIIGLMFKKPITPQLQEAYFGFWVRFDPASPPRQGSKVPGLFAGTNDTGGEPHACYPMLLGKGFSARLMAVGGNKFSNYFYWMDNPRAATSTGQKCGDGPGLQFETRFGEWYFIETRVELNATPGAATGLFETWINGLKTTTIANTRIRATGQTFNIEGMLFHNYFGGPKTWAPDRATHNFFDVVVVSRNRIGKP